RVLLAALPQQQHRELGEVVTGEHVDRAAVDHVPGGGELVPVEPRAVGDPDRALGHGWRTSWLDDRARPRQAATVPASTMSSTEHPRDRSIHGRARPITIDPIARRPPRRSAIL